MPETTEPARLAMYIMAMKPGTPSYATSITVAYDSRESVHRVIDFVLGQREFDAFEPLPVIVEEAIASE